MGWRGRGRGRGRGRNDPELEPIEADLDGALEAADGGGDAEADYLLEDDLEGVVGDGDAGDDPNLSVLREFSSPNEWRTMARVSPEAVHLAAAVYTKGDFLGSKIRMGYVEARFLMSRSEEGWGSGQMKDIATNAPPERSSPMRRLFGMNKRGGS